jgi:hypothetical protein
LLPESAYAFSANSCMLDSMRELDPAIRRGIIDLDENNTSDKELADRDATDVRRRPGGDDIRPGHRLHHRASQSDEARRVHAQGRPPETPAGVMEARQHPPHHEVMR